MKLSEQRTHAETCTFATLPPINIERRQQELPTPEHAEARIPKDVMLDDVINSPKDKPLSKEESKGLGVLLRRLSTEKGTSVGLPVYTGGRPAHVSFTPFASVGRSSASCRTLARRAQVVHDVEEALTGQEEEDTVVQ